MSKRTKLSDDYDDNEEYEHFEECSRCDGHDACRDYGCAFKNGCGHLVKRDPANLNF